MSHHDPAQHSRSRSTGHGWHPPEPAESPAARSSGLLNLADVGRDAGLPHTTLTRYLALLETVFLDHRLPAWSRNLGQRLVKAPKVHLVDTGLACHLIGADARRLSEDRPLLGRLLEGFVEGELRKQLSWADARTVMYHLRTAVGSEVVGEVGPRMHGVRMERRELREVAAAEHLLAP